MSNASNPMLIFTIHDALRQSEHDLEGSVWHAAVHAWYEGHIEAETECGTRSPPAKPVRRDEMPAPPYPMPGHPRLTEIVEGAIKRFPHHVHLATAYAACLAWEAGRNEGAQCAGCSYRGDAEVAEAIRAGRGQFNLVYMPPAGGA
jgi:hypothetical protein